MITHPTPDNSNTDSAATLTWRAHPARQRPRQTLLALALIVALAAGVFLFTASWFWAVGALAVLVISLNRFFFPSAFILDDVGIAAHYPLRTTRLRWDRVKRFAHDRHGGFLSSRARPSRLDAWSGMHIIFNEPDRERAIAAIRAHLPQRAASPPPGAGMTATESARGVIA